MAGAAWTVPTVVVATPTPAFAASCHSTSQPLAVTWTANADSDSSYTSQTGTTPQATAAVAVSSSYTGSSGKFDSRYNMSSRTVSATRDAIILSSVVPTSSTNTASNYHEVVFTFSAPVYNLTFTIEDIDRINNGGTRPGYYDHVALLSGAPFTAAPGSYLTGSGSLSDAWRTAVDNNGDYDPRQSVKVSFAGPVTTFTIRYWTTHADSRSNEFMFVRLSGMSFGVCTQG